MKVLGFLGDCVFFLLLGWTKIIFYLLIFLGAETAEKREKKRIERVQNQDFLRGLFG